MVEKALAKTGLDLTHILITHHHFDHTGGVSKLRNRYNCEVAERCAEGVLRIGNLKVEVLATPGHTADSVCYCIKDDKSGMVFTGDTLFIGGCGRVIEASMAIMWDSLNKLRVLPDETLVYAGHDYTMDNYEFALSIEPGNDDVRKCIDRLKKGMCCVPSTIGQEKKTNVLLRADTADAFARIRKQKDRWG